jgi:hypothetical protein
MIHESTLRHRPATRAWRSIAALASMAVLVAVACDQPKPSQTAQAVATPVTTAAAATFVPTQTAEPIPSAAPVNPSSMDLIVAAEQSGAIDDPTAIMYRLFAEVADSRLPEQYRSDPIEDLAATDIARADFDSYPADIQAAILPLLVRPTSPDSYWAQDGGTASAQTVAFHSTRSAATNCVNGWITRPADAPAKALVWGQCGAGVPDATVLGVVQEAARYIGELWGPETSLMGKEPIPDQHDPNVRFDAPEAGDGLHDLYFVTGKSTRWVRTMDSTGLGVNRETYPTIGGPGAAKASYSVFEQGAAGSGVRLKSVIAHEFFHALERSWNSDGVITNPMFWLVEANAQWAEHHFVPAARSQRTYPFFFEFRAAGDSLSSVNPYRNGYLSWMWPLFIEQEKGAATIGAMWKGLAGKTGFTATMNTVDSFLPFQTRFRDFAVRVWNEQLLPGDPVKPRFQDLDTTFPVGRPPAARQQADYTIPAEEPSEPPHEFPTTLPSLWANYRILKPDAEVHQVVLDFSGLTPQSALDVDILLKIKDKDWERRKLDPTKTRFCLDEESDDFEQAIVVLSNHDKSPSTNVTGKWTIQGLAQSCAELSGTITFTRISVYNEAQGEPMWSRDETLKATVFVDMESDPDPLGGGGYVDVSSRYKIERTTLERRRMGDCTASYGTKSNGEWAFSDQPVGPAWENNITGLVSYELEFAELAIVVHYPFETTENVCNLYTSPSEGVHDLFNCHGDVGFGAGIAGKLTEVDGGPDTITISCRTEGPAMDYTKQTIIVTGTLYLQDEDPSP